MTLKYETLGRTFDLKPAAGMVATCVDCDTEMPIEVLMSAAGYYIGTFCSQCGPYSRESGYFRTRDEAQLALDSGAYDPR